MKYTFATRTGKGHYRQRLFARGRDHAFEPLARAQTPAAAAVHGCVPGIEMHRKPRLAQDRHNAPEHDQMLPDFGLR